MTVFVQVKQIIQEIHDVIPEKITLQSNFVDDLGFDSLVLVEFILAFGNKFEIEIPEEHRGKFCTVADAVYYIEAHTKLS